MVANLRAEPSRIGCLKVTERVGRRDFATHHPRTYTNETKRYLDGGKKIPTTFERTAPERKEHFLGPRMTFMMVSNHSISLRTQLGHYSEQSDKEAGGMQYP
jgi:hypothetical protein